VCHSVRLRAQQLSRDDTNSAPKYGQTLLRSWARDIESAITLLNNGGFSCEGGGAKLLDVSHGDHWRTVSAAYFSHCHWEAWQPRKVLHEITRSVAGMTTRRLAARAFLGQPITTKTRRPSPHGHPAENDNHVSR
jgi:hypothetical protein